MKTIPANKIAKAALVLFISLGAVAAHAQTLEQIMNKDPEFLNTKTDYVGLSVSFGSRSSKVRSNYQQLENLSALQEGGAIGALWGNKVIETSLTLGYYYPSASMGHSINLIEAEASASVKPLSLISKKSSRVSPYLIAAVTKSYYKMYGFYASHESAVANYSVSSAPYLGNLDIYQVTTGAGVSVSLKDDFDFVKLFVDAKYSHPFSTGASADFVNTHFSAQWSLNLGVRFGMNRFSGN